MNISKHAEGARIEREVLAGSGLETEPPCSQGPQEMSMREDQRVAVDGAQPGNHPVRPRRDVAGTFAARAAVAKQPPARPFLANFHTPTSLVVAVVPLEEVGIRLRDRPEAGKFAGSHRPARGAREDADEATPRQAGP